MKTILALSAALLLSFAVPAYSANANGPVPVSKKDHREMMTKKKKKNKKFKLFKRHKAKHKDFACNAPH